LDTAFRLALVLFLVLANAFFVASEFAVVTLRRTRVEQLVAENHPLARSLQRAVNNPTPFIATTQLGVTMASLALGWVGEPALAAVIEPILGFLPSAIVSITSHSIAVFLAFIVITGVDIVVGELIPKNLALQRPEAVSFVIVEPLLIFQTILRPFVLGLSSAGTFGLRLFGLNPSSDQGLVYSVDELKLVVAASRQAGVLEESEEDLIEHVINFADLHAHELMVPRTELVAVPVTATIAETINLAAQTRHEQYPVFETSIDNIVGMVYLVDLVRSFGRIDLNRAPIRPLMREALVVPETIAVDALVKQMRQHRTHVVVLVDEYGGTAGLVKLVDIMESIVGPVPDQFEAAAPEIRECSDGSLLVDGMARISDVNEHAGLSLASEEYDTIGGFVLGEIGRRPRVGDHITYEGTAFEVEEVDGLRIASLHIWPSRDPAEPATDPSP
jgi:CBS domain containing-hemolysin-like protein